MKINLNKKTGFICKGPVFIDNENGPFYHFHRKTKFNLPPGKYTLKSGDIERLERPVEFKFEGKRKPERNIKIPGEIRVIFSENPNKATINLEKGLITLDNKFKTADDFTLKFILYHEIAHYLYKTEEYCDEYAAQRMLKEGYNLHQINSAHLSALHPENPRNRACEEKLKKATLK